MNRARDVFASRAPVIFFLLLLCMLLTFICELIDYKYGHQHHRTTHGNASHNDGNPPIGVFELDLILIIIFEEQPQQRVW